MLEIESPLPMTEGENIAFGVSTKHLMQGGVGVVFSLPVSFTGYLFGVPTITIVVITVAAGAIFAFLKWKERSLGELVLLHMRYRMRPKLIMYDREYRYQGETFLTGGEIDD